MKIELKPNWDNAPEWARYWAVDENGCCWWYENEPVIEDDYWTRSNNNTDVLSDDNVCVTWRESLHERPTPASVQLMEPTISSGIESKLDRIAELLEKLVTND